MLSLPLIKALKRGLLFLKKTGPIFIPIALLLYLFLFFLSPNLLLHLEQRFQQKFVFFSPSEPILALLRFSLTLFFLIFFPFAYLGLLSLINYIFPLRKKFFHLIYFLGLFFFYIGVAFAYFITLPYGIKFLISFKTESLEPAISLSHFVNFFCFFLLIFGFIFELPLILAFLITLNIVKPAKVTKYRKEIFFFIVVFSAIITPTPDAINMSLLAIPLYILFEVGLLLGKVIKKFNIPLVDTQRELQQ
ncbi:MAG: twin-arginine translocase subunit TatC [Caldimicrobium sp.]